METWHSSESSSGASVPYLGCYTPGATMRALLAFLLIFISIPSQAIEISNFKSGLACTNSKLTEDGRGWICQPTENILVTDQGKCVFNGETKLCTWTGFEFDYKSEHELTKIQCNAIFSEPTTLGNPKGVTSRNTNSESYEFELNGKVGHFYNPEYFLFAPRPKENLNLLITTTCKVDEKILFEYRYVIKFPSAEN